MKLFSLFFLLFASIRPVYATCVKSTIKPPSQIIGLQLFYGGEESSWKLAYDLKIKWVRIEIRWDILEPENGKYNFEIARNLITYAHNSGINIVLLINHPPIWAMKERFPEYYFGRFLDFFFTYYQNELLSIKYFEILNETNNPGYGWNAEGLSLEENAILFTRFLRTANETIRPKNASSIIISGGLSPDGFPPLEYLTAMFTQSIYDCIDIIGIHPYGSEGKLVKTQNIFQHILARLNGSPLPIWYTEYGTSTNNDRKRLINSTFSEINQINALFWFSERDLAINQNQYGLVTYEGIPKEEYEQFKHLISKSAKDNNLSTGQ